MCPALAQSSRCAAGGHGSCDRGQWVVRSGCLYNCIYPCVTEATSKQQPGIYTDCGADGGGALKVNYRNTLVRYLVLVPTVDLHVLVLGTVYTV